MDEHRKNAYRFLLYWALLDIRTIAWSQAAWWNPFAAARALRRARLAGHLADRMHNLGLFAAIEFERFDEDWFWRDLERLEEPFAEFDSQLYRRVFEDRLSELQGRSES